jgi:hypothetical protein
MLGRSWSMLKPRCVGAVRVQSLANAIPLLVLPDWLHAQVPPPRMLNFAGWANFSGYFGCSCYAVGIDYAEKDQSSDSTATDLWE